MQINGAVALVTGANRGLGQAYARALVQRGAHTVYAGARHPEDVSDPDVTPLKLDITSPEQVANLDPPIRAWRESRERPPRP